MLKLNAKTSPISRFRGGIHPRDNKERTAHKASEKAPIPQKVWLPLIQNTGLPAKIIVSIGDKVKVGTKIAEAQGNISVPVHASISGKVTDISEYNHPILPTRILTCVIESDQKDSWENNIKERGYNTFSNEELVTIIRDAGIVGLGGGAFPTHVKITPSLEKPIDTLIINGCECEPYLTADHRLMLEKSNEIAVGVKIIAKICDVKRIIIAIENNKLDAIEMMKRTIPQNDGYSVIALKTSYPQGAEKQLIKTLLNRLVPAKGLPMDVGTLVHNVATCYAVYEACRFNKPLVERLITLTGSGIKVPKNLWVRLGTPLSDLVNFCNGYTEKPAKIIFGGPMMGITQYNDEMPITKGTSGVIVLTNKEIIIQEEGPCIRCGRCIETCPMSLLPCEINNFVKKRDFAKAKSYNVLDCIECGSCAYGCPAKIKLVHAFKFAKNEIRLL